VKKTIVKEGKRAKRAKRVTVNITSPLLLLSHHGRLSFITTAPASSYALQTEAVGGWSQDSTNDVECLDFTRSVLAFSCGAWAVQTLFSASSTTHIAHKLIMSRGANGSIASGD
jgi:hypothetical protein